MRINQYFKKSLARQFVSFMAISIGSFLIGAAILWVSLHFFKENYAEQIDLLNKKEKLAQEINDSFNIAFSEARGYFAYGNPLLKENAIAQGKKVISLEQKFEEIVNTDEDERYLNNVSEFTTYYYEGILPDSLNKYDNGHADEVANLANTKVTARVKSFQADTETYLHDVGIKLDQSFERLIRLQTYAQLGFVLYILIILLTLLIFTRVMFRKVGHPLSQLVIAANEMANGKEVPMDNLDTRREDEIGKLSLAFQKMVETVQEKEQDLLAQNEELLAQQDELQAQQSEIEETLEIVKSNELKLQKRNELINKISNSLNKQEVIDSIVMNMCTIIEADCGMMVLLHEEFYSSYGISFEMAYQFKENILNGLSERLLIEKKPFMIKRELESREKGYHHLVTYSYDLYLPVLSANQEVVAILVFSRYGEPFPPSQMNEYEALTRNIAISLEKIKLYEKSEEDRRLNQDILNTIQEGIQLINVHGEILQINNQLKDMFQWEKQTKKIVGLQWEEWTSIMTEEVEDREALMKFLKNAIQTKEKIDQNTFIYKMGDLNQVIKVYYENLYHGDFKVGTVLVHRNITKEFEVDQMKSEFVSTVSHELRTPLASILGFTELMLNRELKVERKQKYLTTIYNEAKRLTALINDFLDVQRMEAGKQTYEKKFINLIPIIEKVVENQQISTNQHHIQFVNRGKSDLILGDRYKIEQVFMNLINNAIKYSPDGGDIEIKLYEKEDKLFVDIKDQGLGIPDEYVDKLFSKFYRIDNSDRRRIGGTGLGLAIVQEIMKAHDGNVTVHSEYGKGSTFTCAFPLILVQSELVPNEKQKDLAVGYKVMIVEDDHSLGQLICQELKESGFQVSYYKNGMDALTALKYEIPDAIVLDILLEENEIDGWGIMEKVKREEILKSIPIFVSSALDEKEKGYSLGATDYLIKPYKPSQLSKAIMQTLLKMGKVGQVYIPEEIYDEVE
ncbi:ATP-binding protein [Bacillus sp. CGMCC 1.16607]|uniref:ATP-binding protein n=1 Tax=Bacillus sp. CGMCC 1.16607 TaxID=3351842 RepID=UPI00362AEEEA